ncbi:hypothetical protein ColTof3_14830 [Colletotrichum tofieldiae]|nr:hypothetical protein ColTof3_14830 [Colletotrichum tofieldiae]
MAQRYANANANNNNNNQGGRGPSLLHAGDLFAARGRRARARSTLLGRRGGRGRRHHWAWCSYLRGRRRRAQPGGRRLDDHRAGASPKVGAEVGEVGEVGEFRLIDIVVSLIRHNVGALSLALWEWKLSKRIVIVEAIVILAAGALEVLVLLGLGGLALALALGLVQLYPPLELAESSARTRRSDSLMPHGMGLEQDAASLPHAVQWTESLPHLCIGL